MWQLSTGQNHKLIIQVSQDYHLALIFHPEEGFQDYTAGKLIVLSCNLSLTKKKPADCSGHGLLGQSSLLWTQCSPRDIPTLTPFPEAFQWILLTFFSLSKLLIHQPCDYPTCSSPPAAWVLFLFSSSRTSPTDFI